MWKRFFAGLTVLAIAAVAFAFLVRPDPAVVTVQKPLPSADSRAPASPPVPVVTSVDTAANPLPAVDPESIDVASLEESEVFKTDASGRLVVNRQTRAYIEAVFAQAQGEELYGIRQEVQAALPASAATEAMQLFDRFESYLAAEEQFEATRATPATDEDARRDFEALQALRVQHFGPELAQTLFGHEQPVNDALVELMRLEQDQTLDPAEREQRARRIRESMPEVAELEQRNRDAAELAQETDESG